MINSYSRVSSKNHTFNFMALVLSTIAMIGSTCVLFAADRTNLTSGQSAKTPISKTGMSGNSDPILDTGGGMTTQFPKLEIE